MSEINESALKVERNKLAICTCFFFVTARLTFAGIGGMLHYWVGVVLVNKISRIYSVGMIYIHHLRKKIVESVRERHVWQRKVLPEFTEDVSRQKILSINESKV